MQFLSKQWVLNIYNQLFTSLNQIHTADIHKEKSVGL